MTASRRSGKWVLFAALLLTVPAPFFMLVVGGLIPTAAILFIAVRGLVVALPKFTGEGFAILAILGAHVAVLGGVLYLAAAGISRALFWALPAAWARLVIVLLVASLVVASFFQVYRLPGHNRAPPANLVGVLRAFAR